MDTIEQIRSEISKILELSDIKINSHNFGWALMLMSVDILQQRKVPDSLIIENLKQML